MNTLLLGYVKDDPKSINKRMSTIEQVQAQIKAPCSVMTPEYFLTSDKNIFQYNYLVDATTGYHYFIDDIIMQSNHTYSLICSIDTLGTYADTIRGLTALVSRSESKFTPYIVDDRIVPSANRIINSVNVGDVGTGFAYTLTVNGG